MSIIGEIAVQREIDMHPKQTAVTLKLSDGLGTLVPYANSYGWPVGRQSAIGQGGNPNQTLRVTLYQQGESDEPRTSDNIIDADGNVWNIMHVTTRLKFPENPGYAAHDCDLTRASGG